MNDREKWRERVRDIRASDTTWWWFQYKELFTKLHARMQSRVIPRQPLFKGRVTVIVILSFVDRIGLSKGLAPCICLKGYQLFKEYLLPKFDCIHKYFQQSQLGVTLNCIWRWSCNFRELKRVDYHYSHVNSCNTTIPNRLWVFQLDPVVTTPW